MNRTMVLLCVSLLILTSSFSSAFPVKNRVRIASIELSEDMIEVGEFFDIDVTITKERLRRFDGEVQVYLSCSGFCDELIGREDVFIRFGKEPEETVEVECQIDYVESEWYQESYTIKVILYEHNLRGNIVKKDSFSFESIRIYSEFYEKNKLRIEEFKPSNDEWSEKKSFTGELSSKLSCINVRISNQAVYDYDVLVRVDLVEKTSMGIPLVEGFGEVRKEIGSQEETINADDEEDIQVVCELSDADVDRREFDIQAVLFAVVDGQYYEIDKSTIQTIQVPLSLGEQITIFGPWIWIVFVAAIGTFILLLVTFKLIIPFTNLKGDEVKEEVKKIKEKRKSK